MLPRLEMPRLPTSGMLARDQTKPGTKILGFGKAAGITDGGDQTGGVQNTNARNGGQPPRGRVIARQFDDLSVQPLDPGIEIAPFGTHFADQLPQAP